jgi:hypothetical protein
MSPVVVQAIALCLLGPALLAGTSVAVWRRYGEVQ